MNPLVSGPLTVPCPWAPEGLATPVLLLGFFVLYFVGFVGGGFVCFVFVLFLFVFLLFVCCLFLLLFIYCFVVAFCCCCCLSAIIMWFVENEENHCWNMDYIISINTDNKQHRRSRTDSNSVPTTHKTYSLVSTNIDVTFDNVHRDLFYFIFNT